MPDQHDAVYVWTYHYDGEGQRLPADADPAELAPDGETLIFQSADWSPDGTFFGYAADGELVAFTPGSYDPCPYQKCHPGSRAARV